MRPRTSMTTGTNRRARITGMLAAMWLAGAISVVPACGGDDDGGTGVLDDTEYCALVIRTAFATQIAADDDFDTGLYRALGELAEQAPNDELRSAMVAFGEHADQADALDPDDPEHTWNLIELLGEPAFVEANEVLNTYLEHTCEFSNAVD